MAYKNGYGGGTPEKQGRLDRDQVKDAAVAQAESLFCEVWGDPTAKSRTSWRWGSKGARSGHVTGPKAGAWTDFESGESGDLFDLWAIYALGLSAARDDFPRVIRSLAERVGVRGEISEDQRAAMQLRTAQRDQKAKQEAEAEALRKANIVAALRDKAQSIDATPAASYLRSRGLSKIPPQAVASYLPPHALPRTEGVPFLNMPSLIVWASDALGEITGGQRIILNRDGSRATNEDGAKLPKFGFGQIKASAVRVPAADPTAKGVMICEGPETAFTLAEATGCEVWAMLSAGAFAGLPDLHQLPAGPVILCPDQDAPDSPAAEQFDAAAQGLHRVGIDLWIARAPEPIGSKGDFNDTAQRVGIEGVKTALSGAFRFRDTLAPADLVGQPVPAPCAPAVMSADEVSEATREAVDQFLSDALPGDQWLIKATLGAGKSHAVREALTAKIKREALAAKIKTDPSFRVLIRVPTHKLGEEFAEDLRALGVSCGVYRGADADDPATPGEKMCRRPEDLKAVRAAGGRIQALCGSSNAGCALCPHFPAKANPKISHCGYRDQDLRSCNVVIIAGDVSLSNAYPKAIKREGVEKGDPTPHFDAVILDETSPLSLVKGADAPDRVALGFLLADLDQLAAEAGHTADLGAGIEDLNPQLLRKTLAQLHDLLAAKHEAGAALTAADLSEADLDRVTLARLKASLWEYLPPITGGDGLSDLEADQITEKLGDKAALGNVVRRINRLLDALIQGHINAERSGDESHPMATVRLVEVMPKDAPPAYIAAELLTRATIRHEILESRVLIMDATPQIDLLRAWFPKLRLVADLRARDGDGVTRVQLVDSLMAYGAIAPKQGSKDFHRQKANSFRVAVLSDALASMLGGGASLITAQRSKDYLAGHFPGMAKDLALGHFGGVRGSNAFKESRVLVTAGRQAIPVRNAERLAEVIIGRPVDQIKEDDQGRVMYHRKAAALLMRDGTGRGVVNERHPDPIVEAVRQTVTEGELDQSQGRGRAVRRGVEDPLLDVRLSSVASDSPVDVLWTLDHVKALGGFAGILLAAGVWPMGRGRARAMQKALAAQLREWGVDVTDIPERSLAAMLIDDPEAVGEALRNRTRHDSALSDLITAVDSGFVSKAEVIDLLGVTVPLSGWHCVTLSMPGADRSTACPVMVKAPTAEEALQKAAALYTGCDVALAEADTPEDATSPAAGRLRAALAKYRCIVLNSGVAAAKMPDVWGNERLARRDLKAAKEMRTFDPLIRLKSYKDSLLENNRIKPDDVRISPQGVFVVKFRPSASDEWQRPRVTEAVIVADTEQEARLVLFELFKAFTEFEVIHAPEAEESDLDQIPLQVALDRGEDLPPIIVPTSLAGLFKAMEWLPKPPPMPEPPPALAALLSIGSGYAQRWSRISDRIAQRYPEMMDRG